MSEKFLETVINKTRQKVERLKGTGYSDSVKQRAKKMRKSAKPHRFRDALKRTDRTNIIAEIKRASPSKGVINANINVDQIARRYETGGAAAISVLTENEYFDGELADLVLAAKTVQIPTLRKDFIIDAYQIYEAAAAGADAVLLIVAALGEIDLIEFGKLIDDLGMDSLIEIHSEQEMDVADKIGAKIIGVNNRNLSTLEVSLDVSRQLIEKRPPDSIMVSESGISSRDQVEELEAAGFNAFLVGEAVTRDITALGAIGGSA